MSEETTNSIPDEVLEEAEVEQEVEDSNDEPESGEEVDDSEEVEHEGKKYRIPKELKSALMMQSDYTRKTQEVANERRQIEQHAQRIEQEAQAHREDIVDYAKYVAVEDRLQQFGQVNWTQLSDDDPVTAQKLWIEYTQLKDTRNQLGSNLSYRQQQRDFEKQQKSAKHLEEGRAVLAREIKDWSPQLASALADFARSDGWSESEITNITAAQVKSLHRSYVGSQILKKQAPKQAPTPAMPVTKVGGTASVKKSPSSMTDKEFAAWRHSQIKNRN